MYYAESMPTSLAIGGRLGRYAVLGRLGAGGMGEVYRARDPGLEREVALKLLPPATADPHHLARFEREARALASLSHPNIVAIYSVEEADGLHFLTMELVEGEPLRDVIPHAGLPLDRFLALAIPLSDAVAAAHERGVLHRDLTPSNVMVDREGRVKVLDFGLAHRDRIEDPGLLDTQARTATLTSPGVLAGTAPYLSPEQIAGRPADARSDLFSLGVIFYEMLTGGRPFTGGSGGALLASILRDVPPAVSDLRPELPRHLGRIVRRCLEKEPAKRYQAARDLVHELQGLREELQAVRLDDQRLAAQPAVPAPAAAAGGRLRFWTAAAGVVVVALAAAVYVGLGGPPAAAATPPVVAVLPLANASGDPASDHLGVGFADSLITRLSRLPSVALVSRAVVGEYAGHGADHEQMARQLGADYLVLGSHQRSGERLLVNVSLVEGNGGVVRGSWQDEDAAADLFDLQRRLAVGVAEGLELTLTGRDRQRLVSAPSSDTEAYMDYSRARELLRRSDRAQNVERAIALLRRSLERDRSFALAHAALGDAYWLQYRATLDPGWAERAAAAVGEAVRLAPDDPEVRVSLARIYAGTGRGEEALAQLEMALDRRPGSDDAWREYGRLLAEQGHPERALAALDKAIEIRPRYWENHYRAGGLYWRSGRYPQAAAAYERAAELEPDNSRVLENLGAAWQAAGDESRAIDNYQRALALDPEAIGAATNIGVMHYHALRFTEAAAAFERAVAIAPRNPLLHRNLGDAYRRGGGDEKARGAFAACITAAEELVRTNPEDAASLALQALCEAKLERHEEAARHVRAAIEVKPREPQVRFRAAVVHALAGRQDEAIDEIRRALALGFSPELIRDDDDLASLRQEPAFVELFWDKP